MGIPLAMTTARVRSCGEKMLTAFEEDVEDVIEEDVGAVDKAEKLSVLEAVGGGVRGGC